MATGAKEPKGGAKGRKADTKGTSSKVDAVVAAMGSATVKEGGDAQPVIRAPPGLGVGAPPPPKPPGL